IRVPLCVVSTDAVFRWRPPTWTVVNFHRRGADASLLIDVGVREVPLPIKIVLFEIRQDEYRPSRISIEAATGFLNTTGGKITIGAMEVVDGQADLLEVVLAAHA